MEGKNPNCKYGRYDCMPCTNCDAYIPSMTNADRIRAMTDEELAAFIADPCSCDVDPQTDGYRECGNELCKSYLLDWLQQPAEEG